MDQEFEPQGQSPDEFINNDIHIQALQNKLYKIQIQHIDKEFQINKRSFYNNDFLRQKITLNCFQQHLYQKSNISSKQQTLELDYIKKVEKNIKDNSNQKDFQILLKKVISRTLEKLQIIDENAIPMAIQKNINNQQKVECLKQYQNEIQASLKKYKNIFLKLQTNKIYDNQFELKKDRVDLVVGLSQEVIYSKQPFDQYNNFCFFEEEDIQVLINEQSKQFYLNQIIQQLSIYFDLVPQMCEFQSCTDFQKDDFGEILQELEDIHIRNSVYDLHHIQKNVQDFCQMNDFNKDVDYSIDTMIYMKNIQRFFKQKFEQQQKFTYFEIYNQENIYKINEDEIVNKLMNNQKIQDSEQLLISVCNWEHKIQQFDIPQQCFMHEQTFILDSLLDSNAKIKSYLQQLVKDILSSSIEELEKKIQFKVKQKMSLYVDQDKQNDQTLISAFQSESCLLFIMIRDKLVQLFSYLNAFRCIQKTVTIQVDKLKEMNYIKLDRNNFQQTQKSQNFEKINNIQQILDLPQQDNCFNPILNKNGSKQETQDNNILIEDFIIEKEDGKFVVQDIIGANIVYSCIFNDFNNLIDEIYKVYQLYIKESQQTSIDHDYLFFQILNQESDFYYNKLKTTIQYLFVFKQANNYQQIIDMAKNIQIYCKKRPLFDLINFSNQNIAANLFKSYQLEIKNQNLQNQLITEIIEFQQKREKEFYNQKQFKNQSIPIENYIKGSLNMINQDQEIFYFSFDKISKFISKIQPVFDNVNIITQINHKKVIQHHQIYQNMILQQTRYIWNCFINNEIVFKEQIYFNFLYNDVVLDNAYNYEYIKREFVAIQIEQIKQTKSQKKINPNELQIDNQKLIDFCIRQLYFNKIRHQLKKSIFSIAFEMDLYKKQQNLFLQDLPEDIRLTYIEKWLQLPINLFKREAFNYIQSFIDLDCIIKYPNIDDFNYWQGIIKHNDKVMLCSEYQKIIHMQQKFAMHGIILNNQLIKSITKEVKDQQEFRSKIKQNQRLQLFQQIFRQKKQFEDDFVNQIKILKGQNKVDEVQNNFEILLQYYQKFISFQQFKYKTILIRNKISEFNNILPFQTQLFQEQPISNDNQQINKTMYFFDDQQSAVNVFNLPNVEFIFEQDDIDLDFFQSKQQFDNKFFYHLNESIEQLYDKFQSQNSINNTDFKHFFNIRFMERNKNDLKKFCKNRTKPFLKGLEYIEQSKLFTIFKVLTCLYENLNYFMFNLLMDSPTRQIINLNNGLMSPHLNTITDEIHYQNFKKNQIQMKQTLDRLFQFKDNLLKKLQEIKFSNQVTNVNQTIIIYMSKYKTRNFNTILNVINQHIQDLRQEEYNQNTINCLWDFLKQFAYNGFYKLVKIGNQIHLQKDLKKYYNDNFKLRYKFPPDAQIVNLLFIRYLDKINYNNYSIQFANDFNQRTSLLQYSFLKLDQAYRSVISVKMEVLNCFIIKMLNQVNIFETHNFINYETYYTDFLKKSTRNITLQQIVNLLTYKSLPNDPLTFQQIIMKIQGKSDLDKFHEIFFKKLQKIMLEDAIHFYEHIDKHDKDNILFDNDLQNDILYVSEYTELQQIIQRSFINIEKAYKNLVSKGFTINLKNNSPYLILTFDLINEVFKNYEMQQKRNDRHIKEIFNGLQDRQQEIQENIFKILKKNDDKVFQLNYLQSQIETCIKDRVQIVCQEQGENNYQNQVENLQKQLQQIQNTQQINEKKFTEELESKYKQILEETIIKQGKLIEEFEDAKNNKLENIQDLSVQFKQDFQQRMKNLNFDVNNQLFPQDEDEEEQVGTPHSSKSKKKKNISFKNNEQQTNVYFEFFKKKRKFLQIKDIFKEEEYEAIIQEKKDILNNQNNMKNKIQESQDKIQDLKKQITQSEIEIQELIITQNNLLSDIGKLDKELLQFQNKKVKQTKKL